MKKLFYLISFYFLTSCSTSDKMVNYSNAPQWVQEYPLSNDHYIGIGISKKRGVKDYREEAKKNAYNEISSVISVSVSSNSVLKQQEENGKFSELFNTTTKTYTNNVLEGCKQVGRWENKNEYWVYYKLDKARIEESKRIAIEDASISLKQALSYDAQNNLPKAISSYSLALSAVKPYLGSRLKTEFNGETIFLGQYILDSYRELISSVKLGYDTKQALVYEAFKSINPVSIHLTRHDQLLTNIPLKIESNAFKYSGFYKFNEKGEVTLPEVSADTYRDNELVILSIDINQMIEESVSDDLVKEILKGYKTTSLELLYKLVDSTQIAKDNFVKSIADPEFVKLSSGIMKDMDILNMPSNETNSSFNTNTGGFKTPTSSPKELPAANPTPTELTQATNPNLLIETIKKQTFDDEKLRAAKQLLSQNNFSYSTEILKNAAEKFSFEESKLAFAKFAYSYVADKKNYHKISSIFSYDSSKEEFNVYIKNQK